MHPKGLLLAFVVAGSCSAHAENLPIDCSKQSLADTVASVKAKHELVSFTGVCAGPIVISTDGLTLKGVGTAIIDGGGENAVEIVGASRVALIDIEVRNGEAGVVARNGAHVSIAGVKSHDNAVGIAVLKVSSADLSGVSAHHNGKTGLLADDGVSITVMDSTITQNAASDLQLTFGARADLRGLVFGTYSCDDTVLVRGTVSITCPH